MRFAALVVALVMLAVAAPGAQSVPEKQTAFEIEHELLKLPTYGVFDFIAFGVERGKVTLEGYAYNGLKSHAERAVKRVPGVDTVDNQRSDVRRTARDRLGGQVRCVVQFRGRGEHTVHVLLPDVADAAVEHPRRRRL